MVIEQTRPASTSSTAQNAHANNAGRAKTGDAAPGGFMALLGSFDGSDADTSALATTDTTTDLGAGGLGEKGKKKGKGDVTDNSELSSPDGSRIASQTSADPSAPNPLGNSLGITPHSFLADAVGFIAGAVVAAAGGGLIASAIASKIGTAVAKANGVGGDGADPAVAGAATKTALAGTDASGATTVADGTITSGMLPQGQNADAASGNIDKLRAMVADSKDAGRDTAKDSIDRMLASDGTLAKSDAAKGFQARGQAIAAANHAASQAAVATPASSQTVAQLAAGKSAADAVPGGASRAEASLLAQQVAAAAEGTRMPSAEAMLASARSERTTEKTGEVGQSGHGHYMSGWQINSGAGAALGVDGAAVGVAGSQGVMDDQMADQLSYYMSQSGQSAEITLDTKDGGPVDVRVSISGNEAQVAFRSDQAHTRDAITSATSQLRDMLQSQGVTLAGVTVDSSLSQQANGNGASGADGFGNRGSGEGRGMRHTLNMASSAPITTTRPVAGSSTGSRLDMYV